jgi:hypothetical protein
MGEQIGIFPQDPFVPALPDLFPIGAVYLTVVNTNPAVLLGFGTWVQIGQGKLVEGEP